MRVIYLHQYFNTPDMSGGTRSYEFARRLVQRGHEVHVITSARQADSSRARWKQTIEGGIHVHWTPVPYSNRLSYPRRLRAFGQFAWRASLKAAQLRADVVFATSTPLTIALPGIYSARCNKIPLVFEVRDLWPDLPIAMGALRNPLAIAAARSLEHLAYSRARHIVALSPGMKEGILRRGVQPDRVSVIPNGCDVELFDVPEGEGECYRRAHAWLGNRPLIVYCGTIGRINGVGYLARLAAEVIKFAPDVRFLIVGDGFDADNVRREAQDLGVLNRNLFIKGRVSKREIVRVLSAADVATSLFIDLPAMWTNSANKFFDALAAGRPIVLNHEGWLAELVRSRGLGLVLDAKNIPESALRLVDYVRNKLELHRSRKACRQLAAHQFNRDLLATKLEHVLLGAVQGKSPRNGAQFYAADGTENSSPRAAA